MTRLKSLFALLSICLLTLFSCQKPEGTLPGSWMFDGGNGLIHCTIDGNLDYAVYQINVNLHDVGAEQVQIDKLELHYFSGERTQDEGTIPILSDTILKSNYQKSDTIWGLLPDKSYRYSVLMADFFNSGWSDTLSFRTLPVGKPEVTLDTTYMMTGLSWCYGTLTYHWRAQVPADSITPYCWSSKGEDALALSRVEILNTHQNGDSVVQLYRFSHDFGDVVTCRFAVHVANTWGIEAWSDTVDLALIDISVVTERVAPIGAHTLVASGRPIKEGEGVLIHNLGFCVAKHYTPTLNDEVYNVSPNMMEWGTSYQMTITGLEAATTYYVNAYLRVNSASGPLYYGIDVPITTWAPVPVIFNEPDDSQVTDHAAYLEGMIGSLGQQELEEYGFIWRKVDDQDPTNDEVSFEDGYYTGFLPCNNMDLFQQFSGLVQNLEAESKYWCRSYAKFKNNGEIEYSDSRRLDTKR